eukprot:SAG11_NODE_1570_length_4660_cov_6.671991_3_plen_106_part_00
MLGEPLLSSLCSGSLRAAAARVRVVEGCAEHLELRVGARSAVGLLCMFVLQHLSGSDSGDSRGQSAGAAGLAHVVANFERVLVPGGWLLLGWWVGEGYQWCVLME